MLVSRHENPCSSSERASGNVLEDSAGEATVGAGRADAILEGGEQVVWVYVSLCSSRRPESARRERTADAGGELKVLASALEVEVGAHEEVASAAPGAFAVSKWFLSLGLVRRCGYLPLQITLLSFSGYLGDSQAAGSRSARGSELDTRREVGDSGTQGDRGKAKSQSKSCELHFE